jgi:hypothetical protein
MGWPVEQRRMSMLAISPCPTHLLIVRLDTTRQIVMDDITDVRLIDPHAEPFGRHEQWMLVPLELVLDSSYLLVPPGRTDRFLELVSTFQALVWVTAAPQQ